MFAWAHKQKLAQRNSVSKSNKSCAETDLHSHPSSPAHSTMSMQSPAKRNNTKQKLKIILTHNKDSYSKKNKPSANNIQGSLSKLDLMKFIQCKKTKINHDQSRVQRSCQQNNGLQVKKQIRIKIQVNRLIDQYCRAIKQFLQYKLWGIFAIGMILLKLGFIQDLVNDRNIAKQIWENLKQPDQLGLYVFLEQVQGQRVQIQMALNKLASQLNIKPQQLNKNQAVDIIMQKRCSNLYSELKLNRIRRQKKTQSLKTQII